jgi:crotonobetainyl-CoA:carnitine CoA-transferase CaiB-like acyl-CoA transferase
MRRLVLWFPMPVNCALDGLLVLDFSRAVAGPYCGTLLGDRGARVIKIEDPNGGDESRGWGPVYQAGESAYFLSLNRNKESLALDLKTVQARDAIQRLIPRADILIENFRPDAAARLGLSHAATRALNPRLIHATVSGFGTTGPESQRPGYDLIVQAMSGLMYANRQPDGTPYRVPFPVTDMFTGLFANQAILTALIAREKTGQGAHVEAALLDCLQSVLCSLGPMVLSNGQEPGIGNAIVPYHTFQCADGSVVIGTPNERIWQRFAKSVDRDIWLEDERFANNQARCDNKDFVLGQIQQAVAHFTRAEVLDLMDRSEIPCGPIHTLVEAYLSPRAAVQTYEHPTAGTVRVPANPIRGLEETTPIKPAPRLGEHTARILEEIGLG